MELTSDAVDRHLGCGLLVGIGFHDEARCRQLNSMRRSGGSSEVSTMHAWDPLCPADDISATVFPLPFPMYGSLTMDLPNS